MALHGTIQSSGKTAADPGDAFTWTERLMLLTAAGFSCALFAWVGGAAGLPSTGGYNPSLLAGATPVVALGVTAVTMAVALLAGWAIAGRVHPDAGAFAAAAGLAALSARSGSSVSVLQGAATPGVFLALAAEVVVLGLFVGACVAAGRLLARRGDDATDPPGTDASLHERLIGPAAQVIVMALLTGVLAQTDDKAQVMTAVAVGACLGTIAGCYAMPAAPATWYWLGPCVVGAIGYAVAWYDPGEWHTGRHGHNLAHPVPLDYAGVGVAVALVTGWAAKRWQAEADAAVAPNAP